MSFGPRASTAYLPEPSCVSWLTTSLTCVPADGRRPSATVLHLPRDGAPPCLPASVDSLATLAPLFFPCHLRVVSFWPERCNLGPLDRASCMSQLNTRAVLVSSPNRPSRCRRPRPVASPMHWAPKSSTNFQPILGRRVRRRRTPPVRSDGAQRMRDCGRTAARQRPIDQQMPPGQSLVDR
jgi:hypothetical protein